MNIANNSGKYFEIRVETNLVEHFLAMRPTPIPPSENQMYKNHIYATDKSNMFFIGCIHICVNSNNRQSIRLYVPHAPIHCGLCFVVVDHRKIVEIDNYRKYMSSYDYANICALYASKLNSCTFFFDFNEPRLSLEKSVNSTETVKECMMKEFFRNVTDITNANHYIGNIEVNSMLCSAYEFSNNLHITHEETKQVDIVVNEIKTAEHLEIQIEILKRLTDIDNTNIHNYENIFKLLTAHMRVIKELVVREEHEFVSSIYQYNQQLEEISEQISKLSGNSTYVVKWFWQSIFLPTTPLPDLRNCLEKHTREDYYIIMNYQLPNFNRDKYETKIYGKLLTAYEKYTNDRQTRRDRIGKIVERKQEMINCLQSESIAKYKFTDIKDIYKNIVYTDTNVLMSSMRMQDILIDKIKHEKTTSDDKLADDHLKKQYNSTIVRFNMNERSIVDMIEHYFSLFNVDSATTQTLKNVCENVYHNYVMDNDTYWTMSDSLERLNQIHGFFRYVLADNHQEYVQTDCKFITRYVAETLVEKETDVQLVKNDILKLNIDINKIDRSRILHRQLVEVDSRHSQKYHTIKYWLMCYNDMNKTIKDITDTIDKARKKVEEILSFDYADFDYKNIFSKITSTATDDITKFILTYFNANSANVMEYNIVKIAKLDVVNEFIELCRICSVRSDDNTQDEMYCNKFINTIKKEKQVQVCIDDIINTVKDKLKIKNFSVPYFTIIYDRVDQTTITIKPVQLKKATHTAVVNVIKYADTEQAINMLKATNNITTKQNWCMGVRDVEDVDTKPLFDVILSTLLSLLVNIKVNQLFTKHQLYTKLNTLPIWTHVMQLDQWNTVLLKQFHYGESGHKLIECNLFDKKLLYSNYTPISFELALSLLNVHHEMNTIYDKFKSIILRNQQTIECELNDMYLLDDHFVRYTTFVYSHEKLIPDDARNVHIKITDHDNDNDNVIQISDSSQDSLIEQFSNMMIDTNPTVEVNKKENDSSKPTVEVNKVENDNSNPTRRRLLQPDVQKYRVSVQDIDRYITRCNELQQLYPV